MSRTRPDFVRPDFVLGKWRLAVAVASIFPLCMSQTHPEFVLGKWGQVSSERFQDCSFEWIVTASSTTWGYSGCDSPSVGPTRLIAASADNSSGCSTEQVGSDKPTTYCNYYEVASDALTWRWYYAPGDTFVCPPSAGAAKELELTGVLQFGDNAALQCLASSSGCTTSFPKELRGSWAQVQSLEFAACTVVWVVNRTSIRVKRRGCVDPSLDTEWSGEISAGAYSRGLQSGSVAGFVQIAAADQLRCAYFVQPALPETMDIVTFSAPVSANLDCPPSQAAAKALGPQGMVVDSQVSLALQCLFDDVACSVALMAKLANEAPEKDASFWATGAWGACSRSCRDGGGVQARTVQCRTGEVASNRCSEKPPVDRQLCGDAACPVPLVVIPRSGASGTARAQRRLWSLAAVLVVLLCAAE
jgi:hypothetical protein